MGKFERKKQMAEENMSGAASLILYLHDLVYMLAVILVVFLLLFRVVVVSGFSMYQTFTDGDYLILLSNTFYHNPRPGDVVVVSKDSFDDGAPIVKRVIATEGQTVDIDFDAGIVYVDGTALDEPYTNTPTNLREGTEFPLVVADNCIFVMGDNRNNSKDSRSLEIGQVDRREVLGKAILLMLPGPDINTEQRDFTRIGAIR